MMPEPAKAALRALRDLQRIRVAFDHPGYIDLVENGLAIAVPVPANEDAIDFILSESGRHVASHRTAEGTL
jgi:hypothetical protein